MRVLHCPTTVGGNPQGLCRAERQLGLDSWSVALTQTKFNYAVDEILWDASLSMVEKQKRAWRLLSRAREFDIIHYNFGSPILPWEIPENHFLGRGVIGQLANAYVTFCRRVEQFALRNRVVAVTFQGDDARQGDYCRQHFALSIADGVGNSYYTNASDAQKRKKISWFDQYADLIYTVNPDLMHVLPGRTRFMPYASVDPFAWSPVHVTGSTAPLVVHAPSHRGVKGSEHIISAIEALKREGVVFNFVQVENLSNDEARKIYEKADLIVDQLLAGWYGAFAVEAMALGKPVICYIRNDDLKFIPAEMRRDLPLINATPNSIRAVLREWLTVRRSDLAGWGARSRAFVEYWHSPTRIATELIEDYRAVVRRKAAHR